MRVIRHELEITDYQTLTMPGSGTTLSVARSRTRPDTAIDLWSLDYEDLGDSYALPLGIYVIGTGNPMPIELQGAPLAEGESLPPTRWRWHRFAGTVVTPSGLVWHVFQGPCR